MCNLEIGTQSQDSKNAQCNLEIARIPRLRGTYILLPGCVCGAHIVLTKFTEYSKAEQMPSVYEHDKHLNNQLVQFIHLSCLYE